MMAATMAGVLVAGGLYLVLQRSLVRVLVGFVLLAHAVSVVVLAAGGLGRRGPALDDGRSLDAAADPLPQAFVLTAIVITFGTTVYLLTVALRRAEQTGDDDSDTA
jgi:multicomponent Na+:H+ antiporter subunit C